LRTVSSNIPGTAWPSSIYSVPPSISAELNSALPPMVWFHGIQSRNTGSGPLGSRGRTCDIIAALAHIMRWVLMTAFGIPVEPEVNSSLPMVSGVMRAIESATADVTGVAARSAKARLATPGAGRSTWITVTPARSSAASALA